MSEVYAKLYKNFPKGARVSVARKIVALQKQDVADIFWCTDTCALLGKFVFYHVLPTTECLFSVTLVRVLFLRS